MKEIELLKKSLLYHMSLHSKELYHSNVWACLIEQDHNFVYVFFSKQVLENYNILGVEREFKNRDLIIWLQKKGFNGEKTEKYYLVMENKIKSLPTKEQLEGYTENLYHNKLLYAIFTGMVNPFGEDVLIEKNDLKIIWRFVDYTIIADKIEQIAKSSTTPSIKQNLNIILEYCAIIKALTIVVSEELEKTKDILSYTHNSELDKIRIGDLYLKIKGADFLTYVRNRKEELQNIDGFTLGIWQSFNRGKVTLDFRYTNKGQNSKPYLLLGVQIEDEQYRIVVERDRRSCQNSDKLFLDFKDNWLNTIEKSASMRNEFCKYITEEYIFVYSYKKIDNNSNSYKLLFENIKRDLDKAANVIKEVCH